MKASDPHTFTKIHSNNNASQQRTMQGHSHQQQKVGPRGGQRGGREQYVARPPQPGNAGAYGTPPGRTASAPPNSGAGDMSQVPPQAFYPYAQGQPFVPNMYYQQQQMMMTSAMQQGAVQANGQVMPQQQQQQSRNPKQNQPAAGAPMQGKPSGPSQQPKMSNGQPVPGSMPQFVQGYPRGPMPPHMAGMPMFPYQVPMYPGNPYAPPGQQQQRPSPNVTQPREKKVLEIINPKTKETILPSKQKPTNASNEAVPEATKTNTKTSNAPAVVPVEKEVPQEENQSKEMNAAPVHDARAELLASAKRALESDKSVRKDAGDGKKGSGEKTNVVSREPVVGSSDQRKKPATQPTPVQLAAAQQKERLEKQRAREEEQRKIAERKAREEEARRLLLEKEKEAAAAKEKLAKEKQDRLKAEIDAKKKMDEKKQALEKLEREAKSEPSVSALGNKINKPTDADSPIVVPTPSSTGKITYAVEVLLQFREKFRDVPTALSPNVIDMTNIISGKPKSLGRQQYSSGRERGDGRHSHGRHGHGHGQQQPQRQSAGGQWQRRAPRGQDPRGGRGAPRPGGTMGLKVDPLKKTANAWKRQQATTGEEQALRTVTQILNKLSRENFEKLVGRILEINISSLSMLESVVELIRNKALVEPKFGDIYADLCRELQVKTESSGYKAWSFIQIIEREGEFFWTTTEDSEADGYLEGPFESQAAAEKAAKKRSELRRILLGQCQEEFEKENHYEELEKEKSKYVEKLKECSSDEEKQKIQTEIAEIDYKTSRLKQRILGNIQFIGELFKQGILTVRVLTWCITKLMNQDETGEVTKVPDEESLECLCKLLTTVGEVFEKKADPDLLTNFFGLLKKFSNNNKLANRHRFMIKDVIDLRANAWKARRKEAKAKKLDEIRKDVEMEQAAKKAESVSHSRIPGKYQNRGGSKSKGNREVIRSVATGSSMMSGFKLGGANNHTIGSQDVRQQSGPGRAGNIRLGGPRTSSLGKSNLGGAAGGRGATGRPTSFRPGGGGGSGGSFTFNRPSRPPPRAGSPGVGSSLQQAKPKTPAMDESEMKRLIKNTLKEYVQVRIKKELVDYLKGLIPKVGVARKLKNGVVDVCLTFIAEGSQKDREATTDAMIILFEEKFLAEDNIKAALPPLLEFLPDIKMDAPMADKHLGSLFAALVTAKAVDITRVADFLTIPNSAEKEQLPSINQCVVTIVGTMLQGIVNNAEAAALVKSKNITLKKLLGNKIDDSAVNDTIAKFKLVSLYSSDTMPLGSEKELKSLISKDSKVDEILRWIQVNVKPDELQNKDFAKVVVVSALEHIETTKGVLSNPSSVNVDPSEAVIQKEAEAIKEYSRLMKRVTSNDSGGKMQADIQVECLEGIAELAQKYSFPPGLVKRLFKELYDNEVIKEEAYMAWKSLRNPSKAHETALAKARDWLHWLETAEEESM